VMLAGVIYLNLPHQCAGGTAFFRHRSTGVPDWRVRSREAVHASVIEAALRMGFGAIYRQGLEGGRWRDYDVLRRMIFEETPQVRNFISTGSRFWEEIDAVDMSWNRLVCFPGFVFHTSRYDPEDLRDGRLIQNLLIYWPSPESNVAQGAGPK